MRTIIFILGISLPSLFCQAQNKVKAEVDSMSAIARNKADKILMAIDTAGAEKLLYSISDNKIFSCTEIGSIVSAIFSEH